MDFRPPSVHFPASCLLTFWIDETSTDGRSSESRMRDDLAFVHCFPAAASEIAALGL
ncbi:hypothetical protein [Bradyrhizobium cajani]|uniref:Uncharacterized protein n=1 Tax=Bradyrhizobium cajani TaxID=1928661 RepID=A0A844TUW8_9BRAD|nr:hypothetical protein [Bradyrhizobium cajani]MVT78721.1 hypothetical protein [Bradyrhizobium cajani]